MVRIHGEALWHGGRKREARADAADEAETPKERQLSERQFLPRVVETGHRKLMMVRAHPVSLSAWLKWHHTQPNELVVPGSSPGGRTRQGAKEMGGSGHLFFVTPP